MDHTVNIKALVAAFGNLKHLQNNTITTNTMYYGQNET